MHKINIKRKYIMFAGTALVIAAIAAAAIYSNLGGYFKGALEFRLTETVKLPASLSCSGSPNPAKAGETVTWTASPNNFPTLGTITTYSWTGALTENKSGQTIGIVYPYETSTAWVTVTAKIQVGSNPPEYVSSQPCSVTLLSVTPLPPVLSNSSASPSTFYPGKGEKTYINYHVSASTNANNSVSLQIYDANNNLVKKLLESGSLGNVQDWWDGKDTNGNNVAAGIYTYRITGSNEFGASNSLSGNVTVKYEAAPPVQLSAPGITAPAMNAVLTNFPRNAYLAWTYVNGASYYQIEIARYTTVWQNPSSITSASNFLTYLAPSDSEFQFRVRAVGSGGDLGTWSNYSYFSYKTTTPPATVTPTTTTPTTAKPATTTPVAITPTVYTPTTADVGNYCAGFYDIWTSSTFCKAVKRMVQKNVFGDAGGRPGALFAPDDPLNRVEAAKVIVSFLNIPTIKDYTDLGFSDVDNAEWYAPYLRPLKYNGIIKGYGDGTFKPSNSVTRAEFLAMTLRAAANVDVSGCTSVVFSDTSRAMWFNNYLCYANKKGIVDGDENNNFHPNRAITRAETAQMLYNAEQKGLIK